MSLSQPSGHLPRFERFSTLTATILIAYTLARYLDIPGREIAVQLPGIYLVVYLDSQFVVALLVAGLSAAGVNWLLSDHPALEGGSTMEHLFIPTLTAMIISLPLSQLPDNPIWWIAFTMGGALLILVILAEYIVVDPKDVRYPPAAVGLTLLSFTIYLVLASSLRYAQTRLFLLIPILATASGLVSLRALHLRMQNRWAFLQAGVITLISTQFGAAIHYWPISPVAFGLGLLGITYASTNLLGNLALKETYPRAVIEPLVMLLMLWGAAFLMQ